MRLKNKLNLLIILIILGILIYFIRGSKIPNKVKENTVKMALDYPNPQKVIEDPETIEKIFDILDERKLILSIPRTRMGGWHLTCYNENDQVLMTVMSDEVTISGMNRFMPSTYYIDKDVHDLIVKEIN